MLDTSGRAVVAGAYVERRGPLCYDLPGWSASGAAMVPVPFRAPSNRVIDHFQWVL